VKLLVNTHHSRLAAERLRADRHDVTAAADDPVLASIPDEELLRAASRSDRAVATENARDFDRIVGAWVVTGEDHAGVVFTSPPPLPPGQQLISGQPDQRARNLDGRPPQR